MMSDITQPKLIVVNINITSWGSGVGNPDYYQKQEELLLLAYSDAYEILKDDYLYIEDSAFHYVVARRKV